MRIRLNGHPELVTDLRDHLRAAGCIAVEMAEDTIEATIADAPTVEQEAREMRAYVRAWVATRNVEPELVHLEPD